MCNGDDNYGQAAMRHFGDAEILKAKGSLDGAGHLIGFAAECAIKYAIENLRPGAGSPHLHLPDIIEPAKKHFSGRKPKNSVREILLRPKFFDGWRVEHRYTCDGYVMLEKFNEWHKDAVRILSAAGLRRTQSE